MLSTILVPMFMLCGLCFPGIETEQKHCHDAFVEIWNDCYDVYDVNLRSPPSYATGSINFFPVCIGKNVSNLIECYENVIAKCPGTYRENGPAMMDVKGFRAFLIGTCVNMQAFEDGKQCVVSKYQYSSFNEEVSSQCLPQAFFDSQWDAYIYNDWENYCRRFDEGMVCVKNKTDSYGCQQFSDFVWYSSYARQPPMCRDKSAKYAWIDMYQEMPTSANPWQRGSTIVVVSGLLLVLVSVLF